MARKPQKKTSIGSKPKFLTEPTESEPVQSKLSKGIFSRNMERVEQNINQQNTVGSIFSQKQNSVPFPTMKNRENTLFKAFG